MTMRSFERVLIDLDSGVSSAVLRVAMGLAIVPVFRLILGGGDPGWGFVALFCGFLVALRVVPAVLRHVLKFSADAKAVWAERRGIAKQHDSYQWQKVFWIGIGLLPYVVMGGGLRTGELIVTVVCLVGGGAGLLLWRKSATTLQPQ